MVDKSATMNFDISPPVVKSSESILRTTMQGILLALKHPELDQRCIPKFFQNTQDDNFAKKNLNDILKKLSTAISKILK